MISMFILWSTIRCTFILWKNQIIIWSTIIIWSDSFILWSTKSVFVHSMKTIVHNMNDLDSEFILWYDCCPYYDRPLFILWSTVHSMINFVHIMKLLIIVWTYSFILWTLAPHRCTVSAASNSNNWLKLFTRSSSINY